jgi:outer membrane protein assembly factor BamC
MTIQRTLAFLVALQMLSFSGCAMFGDKSEKSPAKLREALEVPPDLARPASDDLSAVPPSGAAAYSDYTDKAPEAKSVTPGAKTVTGVSVPENAKVTAAAPASDKVHLERDGIHRWLVVQDAPDRVTDHVRNLLVSRNLELDVDDPKSGIFETKWKDRKINLGTNALTKFLSSLQSTGLRDKFRIRIEPGRAAGTTEVYVSHLGLEEIVVGSDVGRPESAWRPRATDLQAEADMLSTLMKSFGMSEQEVKDQAGKVATGSAIKVKDGLLLQKQDMDQAWRRVGQALDRSGFSIEDRDHDRGVYYVYDRSSASTAKKNTLFGGWLSIGESAESDEDRFQIVLKAEDDGIGLKLLNVKGERTEAKNGQRLLEYLLLQLQ